MSSENAPNIQIFFFADFGHSYLNKSNSGNFIWIMWIYLQKIKIYSKLLQNCFRPKCDTDNSSDFLISNKAIWLKKHLEFVHNIE